MRFPVEGLCRNGGPEFVLGMGCGFPTGLQAEAAFHFMQEFWDWFSRVDGMMPRQ